ncbi:MAG: molecular chaperone [Myxococcaceae bacterium]|nr:molecular chaperone [Myxococcaceae bacterium]
MRLLSAFAVLVIVVTARSAGAEPLAFRLSPMSRELAPAGQGATRTFEVTNPGHEPIAIATGVVTRVVDADGAEHNEPADREFLVYPAQVIVPPYSSQILRVTWMGSPRLEREQAYRLEVAQVPLESLVGTGAHTQRVGQLKLMLRYLASIYVRPEGAEPEVKVQHAGLERDAQGRPRLRVTLSNDGRAHASLRELTVRVRAHDGTATTELQPMQAHPGASAVVLPGGLRRLDFAWPASIPEGPVDVDVSPRTRG